MIREVITDVLLGLAVLIVAASALGIAVMPNAYAKLHYVTPAAVVAPVLVLLAVLVTEGLDENTGETVVALVFMIAAAPFLSHATVRAIRVREAGDWRGHPPGTSGEQDKGGKQPGNGAKPQHNGAGDKRGDRDRARESR